MILYNSYNTIEYYMISMILYEFLGYYMIPMILYDSI